MGEAAHDRGIGPRGVGVMAPLPAGVEERDIRVVPAKARHSASLTRHGAAEPGPIRRALSIGCGAWVAGDDADVRVVYLSRPTRLI